MSDQAYKTVASLRRGLVVIVDKSEIKALKDELPDHGVEIAVINYQDALRWNEAHLVERLNDVRLCDKVAIVEGFEHGDQARLTRFYETFNPCFIEQGGRAIWVTA